MKKNLTTMLSCCIAAGGLMLVGCTDSNYDLGNLDKHIAIGSEQEFVLPGNNSTHDIALGDVIDLPADGAIQTDEDGNYFFSRSSEDDDLNATDVVVEEIPLVKDEGDNDTEVDITDFIIVDEDEARASAPRRADGIDTFGGMKMKSIYDFSFNTDDTPFVLGLSMASLRAGMSIKLDFTDELRAKVENIKQIAIGLPAFFDIDIESDYSDLKHEKSSHTNLITLTNIPKDGIGLHIKLNQLVFSTKDSVAVDDYGYYLYADHNDVMMKGGVMLGVVYEDPAAARGNAPSLDDNLKILCHSTIDDITLTGAEGYFNPEIKLDNIGQFSVGDLPDFLDDPEVTLNVADPEIRLYIDSNVDLKGIISGARIMSFDDNGDLLAAVPINDFVIQPHKGGADASTTTTIIISDTHPQDSIYVNPLGDHRIADLLTKLPSTVTFECTALADSTEQGNIELGRHYTILPGYEVYAPLSFNVGTQVVYRDTIDGWHENLEDVTLSRGATVTLTADILNSLPIALDFTAKAIDADRRAMSENTIDVQVTNADGTDVYIPAGSDANPGRQTIKIVMTQKDDKGFSVIDGIALRAAAKSSADFEGYPLNDNTQKLKVQNIGITLRGRVIVDLDD